jgi:hypothetical protein
MKKRLTEMMAGSSLCTTGYGGRSPDADNESQTHYLLKRIILSLIVDIFQRSCDTFFLFLEHVNKNENI